MTYLDTNCFLSIVGPIGDSFRLDHVQPLREVQVLRGQLASCGLLPLLLHHVELEDDAALTSGEAVQMPGGVPDDRKAPGLSPRPHRGRSVDLRETGE